MNAPDRSDLVFRDPSEKSVTFTEDTRVANTTLFIFHKEDHTLGNLLADFLLRHNCVLFAAYQIKHPLDPNFTLRVTTDGSQTPREMVKICSEEVIKFLGRVKDQFPKEVSLRKIASQTERDPLTDQYVD